jgi:hypothetical protein
VSAQLIKGKTTQENVRGLYGDPAKTSFTDSGNEIWEYDFSRMHSKPTNFIPYVSLIHSGAEGDKKSLVIFFDRSKVVRQYTISSSKVDVSQGLITRLPSRQQRSFPEKSGFVQVFGPSTMFELSP